MTGPSDGATTPAGLRIVQEVVGKSLIVALPLPNSTHAPQQSSSTNSVAVAAALPTHDRVFWQRLVTSSVLLKIGAIIRGLGLRQLNTGAGRILFQHTNANELAGAVANAVNRLPETSQGLVEAAADYNYAPLQQEIAQLLHRFGEEIWSADRDREWLLKASDGYVEYQKDLTFEDASDKVVLIYHLRLWILVKAFNRVRNKAAKSRNDMSAQASAAGQFNSDMSTQPSHQSIQGTKRPRRVYLSEEIIRNSSDESEEDNSDQITLLLPESDEPDILTDQTASSAEGSLPDLGEQVKHTARIDEVQPIAPSEMEDPVRQRLGACKSCQQRHQRCDRARPVCGRCAKLDFVCEPTYVAEPTGKANSAARTASAYPTRAGSNIGHEPKAEPAKNNSKSLITGGIPLTSYWSRGDWESFLLEGDERKIMLATMRSLGLRATIRHDSKLGFDVEHFVSLGEDIIKLGKSLTSKLSAAQLVQGAEDSTYLDDEIDNLFDTHSVIWSLDANRTKLLSPGVDENYPKNLVYEESHDQKLLWIHIHRWIFLVAFVMRKQIDASGETGMNPEDRAKNRQLDYIQMFEVPQGALSGGSQDTTSPDSTSKPTKTPPSSDPPPQKPTLRKPKRKTSDAHRVTLRPIKHHRTTPNPTVPPGHDLCILFLSYLETHTDPSFNDLPALTHLTTELSQLQTRLQTQPHTLPAVYASPLAAAFLTTCFPAWLHYRAEIATVRRQLADLHNEQPQLHRHLAVLQRSRLAAQLRLAREVFVAAGYGGLRAEQVIVRAVEGAMSGWGYEVGDKLRRAFREMEEGSAELGDELMTIGGRRWIMGDFPAVGELEGMSDE